MVAATPLSVRATRTRPCALGTVSRACCPVALLRGQLGTTQSSTGLLFDRGAETVIGAVVAIALLAAENRRAHHW